MDHILFGRILSYYKQFYWYQYSWERYNNADPPFFEFYSVRIPQWYFQWTFHFLENNDLCYVWALAHKIETWFSHHNAVCHVLYFYNSNQRTAYRNLCMEKTTSSISLFITFLPRGDQKEAQGTSQIRNPMLYKSLRPNKNLTNNISLNKILNLI